MGRPTVMRSATALAAGALLAISWSLPERPALTGAQAATAYQLVLPVLAADSAAGSVSAGAIETRHVSSYTDATNPDAPVFFVVGELVNGRPHPVERVELTAKFFNAQGQQLSVDGNITYADLEVIPAGGDSPFSFAIVSPPAAIANFTIAVSAVTDPAILPAVEGLTATVGNTRTEGAYRFITGTVRNDSTFTWQSVTILVAYYDASGRVVRTDLTFPALESLAPAQQSAFESFVKTEGTNIVSQRVWVRATR